MQSSYTCPFCRGNIPADDVNVATDKALCRTCGKTSSFAMVSGASEISMECLRQPPGCIRAQKNPRGGRRITYHRLSPVLFFMVPFTALWAGGSMMGIYGSQLMKGEFDLTMSLFGLPFLFGTVILLGVVAFLAFGKWVITLAKGTGTVFIGVGSWGWTRLFTYDGSSLVSLCQTSVQVNNVPQQGICVRTGEEDFVFGALLKEEAKLFIAAAIMREVSEC